MNEGALPAALAGRPPRQLSRSSRFHVRLTIAQAREPFERPDETWPEHLGMGNASTAECPPSKAWHSSVHAAHPCAPCIPHCMLHSSLHAAHPPLPCCCWCPRALLCRWWTFAPARRPVSCRSSCMHCLSSSLLPRCVCVCVQWCVCAMVCVYVCVCAQACNFDCVRA